jgi:hypothetical protein
MSASATQRLLPCAATKYSTNIAPEGCHWHGQPMPVAAAEKARRKK